MAVRVMSNRAVGLTYGQRALMIGAIHPRLFGGTIEHTTRLDLPYNRLARTARMFETVFLGTRAEADQALGATRRRHAAVAGRLRDAAGPHHPAGAPYSATDPHLMYLTMAFAFDSVDVLQNLLVRRLDADERERLWQDFVRWAELFGMPRNAAPATYRDFRADFAAFLAGEQPEDAPYLTDHARVVGLYLAGIKRGDYDTPPPLRPLFRTLELVIKGSLPPVVRRLYGFTWTSAHRLAFQTAARTARTLHLPPLPFVPSRLRPLEPVLHGPSERLFQLAANRERYELSRGRRSMPEAFPGPDDRRRVGS
jgi:uncharacterized protein (DUF2236 family)